ncbi:hypothetical protein QTO00_03975, partial [Vibrio sp. M260118]
MPNSEVKRISADGSVGLPHVRVGHRQALIANCLLYFVAFYSSMLMCAYTLRFSDKNLLPTATIS